MSEYIVPVIKQLHIFTKSYTDIYTEYRAQVYDAGTLLNEFYRGSEDDAKDAALCWIADQFPIPKSMETLNAFDQ